MTALPALLTLLPPPPASASARPAAPGHPASTWPGTTTINLNATYDTAHGYPIPWSFTTAGQGRPQVATALGLIARDSVHTSCIADRGNMGGSGYDGGHLIAHTLNGVSERFNLVPQRAHVNRGIAERFEHGAESCLRAGTVARYEVRVTHPPGSGVAPSRFAMRMIVTVGGNRSTIATDFPNADVIPGEQDLKNRLDDDLRLAGCT
ncbi:DNA/RNA non-specific endonuclease [Spongiactinospora sp. 9N601]|uniref:DNA/RNA non-specific endonuclease n=1 Tax=Spongiactinospora sp. 9N601 TaxID=3375149 RepID=UPI003798192A